MDKRIKFLKVLKNLKSGVEYSYSGEVPTTEELFNNVNWVTGVAENDTSITTTVNPHTELTWAKVNAEMTRFQTEYDSLDYARKREAEYPKIGDQLDDIYHNGIDGWKATIKITKDKHPKEE